MNKVAEGRPHIVDMLKNDEIALVVNTVEEKRAPIQDSYQIRRAALVDQMPTYTTMAGARAAAIGMKAMRGLVPYVQACTGACTMAVGEAVVNTTTSHDRHCP